MSEHNMKTAMGHNKRTGANCSKC